jgi:putative transposase
MTTRWRPDFDPDHLYFITTTTADHTHIFQRDIVKRLVVDALHYISLMNHVSLYAFVIMPNHVHVIIQCPPDFPPKDWARAFKTSAAQLIVRLYQVEENQAALRRLAALVTRPDRQEHKVWEDGYLPKSIVTPEFLVQKMTYTHNNPVQEHWRLVDVPEDYAWSSARYYLQDEPCIIPIQDVRQLLI